jgi:hypothetical protein
MFESKVLYIFIRGIEMHVCFGFTVPLKVYSEVFLKY